MRWLDLHMFCFSVDFRGSHDICYQRSVDTVYAYWELIGPEAKSGQEPRKVSHPSQAAERLKMSDMHVYLVQAQHILCSPPVCTNVVFKLSSVTSEKWPVEGPERKNSAWFSLNRAGSLSSTPATRGFLFLLTKK